MSKHITHECKNCGKHFTENYCNHCGEKFHTENDKSLKHILEEAVHFTTHFESKLLLTIKTIAVAPGKFSLDFCNGIRKKYFKPISLFLLFVVLYLLFPKMQGLNMRLETYVSDEYNYTWYASPLVKQKIISTKTSFAPLAEKYNNTSPKVSKMLLLLYLPLMALVLNILFYKRKRLFFDHFILATEFNSFVLAIVLLLFPSLYLIAYAGYYLFNYNTAIPESVLGTVLTILFFVFGFTALKRFYNEKGIWTLLKTILFVGSYLLIHALYNIILLIVVLAII
jgi:hypothetical protein